MVHPRVVVHTPPDAVSNAHPHPFPTTSPSPPTSQSATGGGTSPRPWSNRGGEGGRDGGGTFDIVARRVSSRLITDGGALDAWCAPVTRARARDRAARDAAAARIAGAWRRHLPRARYRGLRDLARAWSRLLPASALLLHSGAPSDATLAADVASRIHVRFAMIASEKDAGGVALVYRVCTHGPVVDVGGRNVGSFGGGDDEDARNPWRTVEDDNGFLRSVAMIPPRRKPSAAEVVETYTVRMPRQRPREERTADAKRRAWTRRRRMFGMGSVVVEDEDEDEDEDENLLAWSASLDFDAFERSLEALA